MKKKRMHQREKNGDRKCNDNEEDEDAWMNEWMLGYNTVIKVIPLLRGSESSCWSKRRKDDVALREFALWDYS